MLVTNSHARGLPSILDVSFLWRQTEIFECMKYLSEHFPATIVIIKLLADVRTRGRD